MTVKTVSFLQVKNISYFNVFKSVIYSLDGKAEFSSAITSVFSVTWCFWDHFECSPDCRANHWYTPPHSPRTVLIQSEQKGWQNHSGPLTSSTLPLWTVTVWSTLQSSEHQNDQTQEQFLPPSNPSHELLILNMEHTTLIYSPHTLIFFILNSHMSDLTHNCLHCIFAILYIAYLNICILFFCCLCLVLLLLHCGAFVTIKNSSYV